MGTTFKSYASIRSDIDDLAAAMKVKLKDDFGKYGVSLRDFFIQDVSVPEEIQAAFRKRATMGALGVDNYMQLKAADALGDMAQNEGAGGQGMTMGAGLGMGMMMPAMMQQAFSGAMAAPAAAPAAPAQTCSACHQPIPGGTKFCPNCGAKVQPAGTIPCPGCQQPVPVGSKFCPNCGGKVEVEKKKCACGAELDPNAKFCPQCGAKQ